MLQPLSSILTQTNLKSNIPVQAIGCVVRKPNEALGVYKKRAVLLEVVKEDKDYILRLQGFSALRLGVSKTSNSNYKMVITKSQLQKEVDNVNSRWSIVPYKDDTVYLKNGHGVYLAVDSCQSGRIKFESDKTTENDERCRWTMLQQAPTNC
jgi:hypothetical protein